MRLAEAYEALREECAREQPDVEMVRALVSGGADPNHELARSQLDQQAPLHFAAQHNHVEAAQVLLNEGGADPNVVTDARNAPLHLAAEQGHVDMTALLLRSRAEVDATTVSSWTALHWAASRGRREVVELLLQAGALVDARTERGETSLHLACAEGHEQTAIRLLNAQADPEALTVGAMTPYDLASRAGHNALAETLRELRTSGWEPGGPLPRTHSGATSPERVRSVSPERARGVPPGGAVSPTPMIRGASSFSTPGWVATSGEAELEGEVDAAEASLERRDPAAAFLACHALLEPAAKPSCPALMRQRVHSVLFAAGQFMIEQRAAGKWHEAVLITKMEGELTAATAATADLTDKLSMAEGEIQELNAKLKLQGSGPDEATRAKLEKLTAVESELEEKGSALEAEQARAAELEARVAELEGTLGAAEERATTAEGLATEMKGQVAAKDAELADWATRLAKAQPRMKELSEFFWNKTGKSGVKKKLKEVGDEPTRWTTAQQMERVVELDTNLLADDVSHH